jgi:predicted amidohydrolase YtcJ
MDAGMKDCVAPDNSDFSMAGNTRQENVRQIQTGHDQWLLAIDAINTPVLLLDCDYHTVRANIEYVKRAGIPDFGMFVAESSCTNRARKRKCQ